MKKMLSVVAPSLDFNGFGKYTWDVSVLNIGAYAGYNFKIPSTPITVKPRIGLNYENLSFSSSNNAFSGFGNDGGISVSFGVGVTYPLSSGMTAYFDFTDKGVTNNIGAGVQIKL